MKYTYAGAIKQKHANCKYRVIYIIPSLFGQTIKIIDVLGT